MSTKGTEDQDLLKILVESKVISQAQADLAVRDSENMDMGLDEVLLARRWVSEAVLREKAPWLFNEAQSSFDQEAKVSRPTFTETSGSSDDYGANLARYRSLLREILGPDN